MDKWQQCVGTHGSVVDELLYHVVGCLRLLHAAGNVAHAVGSAEFVLRTELDACTRLLLDLLDHVTALADHNANHRPGHRNLSRHHTQTT